MAKSSKKTTKKSAAPTKPKSTRKVVKKTTKKAPKAARQASAALAPATVVEPVKQETNSSLAFAIEVAKLAKADKCYNVAVLDVKGLSPVTDYLVLATGTSGRQMRSTADDAIELGKESNFSPLSSSGLEGETWICVDFVDVLLHLFNEDSRSYYDLESLWGDAKRVEVDFG